MAIFRANKRGGVPDGGPGSAGKIHHFGGGPENGGEPKLAEFPPKRAVFWWKGAEKKCFFLLFFVKKTWKKKVQGERPFGRGFTKSYWGKLLALNRFWPQNQRFLKKRRFLENSRRSGRETHFSRFLSLFAHFFCTFCTFRHKISIIGAKPI